MNAEELPDISIFELATIYSSEGDKVPFASLFEPDTILVVSLVRHWNCGSCQTFVEALGSAISPDKWAKLGAQVIVIGHGEAKHIDAYDSLTHCPFEIYSDPKRQLYERLNLGTTATATKTEDPKYQKRGAMGDIVAGIKNGFKMRTFTGAGSVSQLGGDYVFKTDAKGDTVCTFARKMPNVRSHAEPELLYNEAKKAYFALQRTVSNSKRSPDVNTSPDLSMSSA